MYSNKDPLTSDCPPHFGQWKACEAGPQRILVAELPCSLLTTSLHKPLSKHLPAAHYYYDYCYYCSNTISVLQRPGPLPKDSTKGNIGGELGKGKQEEWSVKSVQGHGQEMMRLDVGFEGRERVPHAL